jgi:hypothetical protein
LRVGVGLREIGAREGNWRGADGFQSLCGASHTSAEKPEADHEAERYIERLIPHDRNPPFLRPLP